MRTIYSWRPEKKFPRPKRNKLKKLAESAAAVTGSGISGTLSVSFVSGTEMAEINSDYVGHEGLTDVICFDYRESKCELPQEDGAGPAVEVEIIICPAVAMREADKRGLPYSREVVLYLVHGLLHAAGEDDLKPELKRIMRRRELKTINELAKHFDFAEVFPDAVRS